jgi:hypothetical protein
MSATFGDPVGVRNPVRNFVGDPGVPVAVTIACAPSEIVVDI